MKIISIGGGSMGRGQTLRIDRYVVQLAGARTPRALFIPTASGDDAAYCKAFDRVYGSRLGCRTDHLLLHRRPGDRAAAAAKIRSADLIYVGGGNTLRMMKLWRRLGIDRMLISAGRRGTVLAGLSAGAICWHAAGHSDSLAYTGRKNWAYIKVRALGLKPGLFCPHLDSEKRHDSFMKMVARERVIGIACDDLSAIHYNGSAAVCLSARPKARVHIYRCVNGKVAIKSFRDRERVCWEEPGSPVRATRHGTARKRS